MQGMIAQYLGTIPEYLKKSIKIQLINPPMIEAINI
jgi:hypothetical protein